jgi:UDP-GlcNAc:undecaprenyl-phosphate GlcNAc-1-phosphate transferase
MPFWLTPIVAFAGAVALTPVARVVALRLKAIDCPDGKRKLQKKPVPLWGGVAVYLAMVLALLLARFTATDGGLQLAELSTALIAAAGCVCFFGCLDDRWELGPRVKLLLQICSVLPIVLAGYSINRVVAFGVPIELGWWGVPITVLWLVGCINALNLLDGMDGLASVVGMLTALVMSFIATSNSQPHVALIALALAGALAGFLVYNSPPASIYLGDSGSMVIGLVVGVLGIQGALKTTATLAITTPVVVMSIPLLDTVLAIIRRKLTGKRFDVPDRGHIHHRLLDRGLSTWQALCIIGALCLLTGAAATAATIFRSDAVAWAITISVLVLMLYSRAFGDHELSLVKLSVASGLARVTHRLVTSTRKTRSANIAALAFDDAWASLVEEATVWQVKRLKLERCGNAASSGQVSDVREREWLAAAQENITSGTNTWSLSMTFGEPAGRGLQLTAAGQEGREPWQMLHVSRLLKKFGDHWADRLDGLPSILRLEPSSAPKSLPSARQDAA